VLPALPQAVQKLRTQERRIEMRRQYFRTATGLMAIARVVGEKTRKGEGHASHACTRLCGRNGNNHTCWGRQKKKPQQGDEEFPARTLVDLKKRKIRRQGGKKHAKIRENRLLCQQRRAVLRFGRAN
jgi:hypothetical protein